MKKKIPLYYMNENYIDLAKLLINEDMDKNYIKRILKSLVTISAYCKNDDITLAKQFIKKYELPLLDRETVVTGSQSLITKKVIDEYDIPFIWILVGQIPLSDWSDLLVRVKPLIEEKTNGFHIVRVLSDTYEKMKFI